MPNNSVNDLLDRIKDEIDKNKNTVDNSDSTADGIIKRITEKEIEQTQYHLYDGARIMRSLKKNFNDRYDQRKKTCAKLLEVKEKIKDRMTDKKIADTVSHTISIAGGIAAFIPPVGTIVAGVAAGTSFAMSVASDVVTSILDEKDLEEVNGCLNMEHVLEAESGRLVGQLDNVYALLEVLGINADRAQVLMIVCANYDNVRTRGLVESVLNNTPAVGSFFEGPRSGHFVDPVTGVIKLGKDAVSGLKLFATLAVMSGSKKLSKLSVVTEGLATGIWKTKDSAKLGTKLGNALNSLTIVLDLYQIVALWASTEHEATKMMDDLYDSLSGEIELYKKAADDLNSSITV